MIGTVVVANAGTNVPIPQSQTYDCYRPPVLHCDLVTNQFTTKTLYGVFQKIYGVTSPFEPVKGVQGGNALSLKGHIGEYLTIPNSPSLNPDKFTVSFYVKRSPTYSLDGAIISHVNADRTAGWFMKSIVMVGHTAKIQFSVTNTDGEIFTVEKMLNNGTEFEKVVGEFDGSTVKLSINNASNSTAFKGVYQPDPDTTFNLGRLGQDVWKGIIDELHFGGSYWPFNNDTKDVSGNKNDGRLASLTVSMAFAPPPDGRLFFSEKNTGLIRIMTKDDKVLDTPFVKVQTEFAEHQGLLGITVDPKFSSNHFIYAYYTKVDNKTETPFNRVVRFTESNNLSVGPEKILLDNITASKNGEFAGGALAFGKDDNLYITVGYANDFKLAQDKNSLAGKTLRITRDGKIPADNPFPNSPIFTLGHRSQFGITFDNKTGIGFETENGDQHYDEVNRLQSGGNYGFPTTQQLNSLPELDTVNIKPIRSYYNDLSPTQAIFYHLSKNENLDKNLNDKLLFGSYNKGKIIALGLSSSSSTSIGGVQDETEIHFPKMTDNIIALAQSPITGDLYFGGYNIYKLTSVVIPSTEHFQSQQMDFVTFTGSRVKNLDVTNSSLSITLSNDTDMNTKVVDVKIPNKVLHGIFGVQGDDVKDFKIGQSRSGRITNQSSTTVHIDLNPNPNSGKEKIGGGVITINGTA
jgi:hypothetical protein